MTNTRRRRQAKARRLARRTAQERDSAAITQAPKATYTRLYRQAEAAELAPRRRLPIGHPRHEFSRQMMRFETMTAFDYALSTGHPRFSRKTYKKQLNQAIYQEMIKRRLARIAHPAPPAVVSTV